ncbi:uncharacterized protein LOC121389771 [Gigantopelta aegis]|uniref:uncharacterized protein LOC121389771 n=1 Tax=Gigantopelta aegis TaxID=1735272 RepID=UPI001B8888A6|nr:uncharacterized protein LOC121389771 [Gigantopelta aegis]
MDTRLHEAVRYGCADDVRKALAQRYDPNLIGLYLWNPVHEASHNGEAEILTLLLRNKGDPNQVDKLKGNTAVHYACQEGHPECLRLLLDAGGRPDIDNNDRLNAVDLATPECVNIIHQHVMERSKQTERKSSAAGVVADVNDDLNNNKENKQHRKMSESSNHVCVKSTEFPAMGHLHLSFEYHVHKGSLKIRVWQVGDLLLPPPQTSMIHTIFVRSYFIPDIPKKTNRKTEEVRVSPNEAHFINLKPDEPGIQHIFTPSNFLFTVPLQYTGVTKEIINERSVQIEVCMTQKYSRRIFLIGMLKIPLKKGVKMLIREKYPLIPCMNYTIPNNMKVYSSCDIALERSNGVFYSSPVLSDNNELTLPETTRSASDIQLQGVQVQDNGYDPSVLINMPEDRNGNDCQDNGIELQGVKVRKKIKPDFSTIDIPICDSVQLLPGQLEEVKVDDSDSGDKKQCVVNLTDSTDRNKFSDSHVRRKISPKIRTSSSDAEVIELTEKVPNSPHCSHRLDHSMELPRGNGSLSDAMHSSPIASRPETPVWDYYDFDAEEEVKLEKPADGPMPPCLPMTVGLILPSKEQTVSSKKEKRITDYIPEIHIGDFDVENQNVE